MRLIIIALFLLILNGVSMQTSSYFITLKGLAQTPEISTAIQDVFKQIKFNKITYSKQSINYQIDNILISAFEKAEDVDVTVVNHDFIKISGKRILYTYKFNYTKTEGANSVKGYASGSVLSDTFTYIKGLIFKQAWLAWQLRMEPNLNSISITDNKMQLEEIVPFNRTDLANLEDMLTSSSSDITPTNFQNQLLSSFNNLFANAINDNLNQNALDEAIIYTLDRDSEEKMEMTVLHQLWYFIINEQGFSISFNDVISGLKHNYCKEDDEPPMNAKYPMKYGEVQTFFLSCFYQNVVNYLLNKRWLNVKPDETWATQGFAFRGQDLYGVFNNFQETFTPDAKISGDCVATSRQIYLNTSSLISNAYKMNVSYECIFYGEDKTKTETIPFINLQLQLQMHIQAAARKDSYLFRIGSVSILEATYQQIEDFRLVNYLLMISKINLVLAKLKNAEVFGTGFPALARKNPITTVSYEYAHFFDPIVIPSTNEFESR